MMKKEQFYYAVHKRIYKKQHKEKITKTIHNYNKMNKKYKK